MVKFVVYEASGKCYVFRSVGGDGSLAAAMGKVVFSVEHENHDVAKILAQTEAKKRGLSVEGL